MEIRNNASEEQPLEFIDYLAQVPENGLHVRELALLNESQTGFAQELGLRFTEVTPTQVCAELHVTAGHLQITGLVNGGVYCAIAETVGSVLGIIAAQGKIVSGVNNNTDFLAPVGAGVISAVATVIRAGKTTQLIQVELFHREKLVARSTLRTLLAPAPVTDNPGRRADKFA